MKSMFRAITRVVAACVVPGGAGTAHAGQSSGPLFGSGHQGGASLRPDRSTTTEPGKPRPADLETIAWSDAQAKRRGINPVVAGAAIGAAAAAGITFAAAASYGENEGGKFCGRCFVQWSTFSVPAGAGLGAAIGWGIGRARRSVTAVPVLGPKAAGVIVSARF